MNLKSYKLHKKINKTVNYPNYQLKLQLFCEINLFVILKWSANYEVCQPSVMSSVTSTSRFSVKVVSR